MKLLFSLLFLSISFISIAQGGSSTPLSADTIAMLDKIMDRYSATNPGAQLAISRNGEIIYSAVRGMADLEHGSQLTKTSKIEAGSVSKQFTAAAILLLEKEGKLSLNDDIRKYVPEVPDYGYTITLRHLMQHTSGVRDWGSIADLAGEPRGTKVYTNDDALEIIRRQKTLNNKPGDEYIYSNSGYTLLSHVVGRVSGMSHADFCKKYIFEPAGMKNTEWRDDFRRVVAGRAIAYNKNGRDYSMNMPFENTYGHGGLLTTAEDLLAWNNYYLGAKLGGPDLLKKQVATTPFNNSKPNLYAAGLLTAPVRGWEAISHNGATAAYRANLEHFPKLALSIAWLSNTSQGDLGDVSIVARNVFVKNIATPSTATVPPAANIPLSSFAKYAGAYKEGTVGAGFKVIIRDTVLWSEPDGKLIPTSVNTAAAGRSKIVFHPKGLTFITSGDDTLNYTKVDTANTAVKSLEEYAGVYSSTETDSRMSLSVKNGKLVFSQRGMDVPLTAMYKDGFSMPGGDMFFKRDTKGKVEKMYISIARARNVEFSKTAKQ